MDFESETPHGMGQGEIKKIASLKAKLMEGLSDGALCAVPSAVSDQDARIAGFQGSAAKTKDEWS